MPIAPPDEDTKAYFRSILPDDRGITVRPMFGNISGFVNGNMFVGVFGADVFVRLAEADRAELLKEPGASHFEPVHGRPMAEYVTMPNSWREESDKARDWVSRSLSWASEMPPKQPKKRTRKR